VPAAAEHVLGSGARAGGWSRRRAGAPGVKLSETMVKLWFSMKPFDEKNYCHDSCNDRVEK
jgi:hypothetical protein